jgi:uroporphyrinogen decarboxylase
MNAKQRVLKTLDHREPDRVPSFEGSIDNLRICEYYREKYGFQGIGQALKLMSLVPFKNKVIKKSLSSKDTIKKGLEQTFNLYRKAHIDLMGGPLSMFPVKYFKWGYVDEFGRTFKAMKNPSDNMDILFYNGGYFKNFEDYEAFDYPLDINDEIRELNFKTQQEIMQANNFEVYIIPGFGALLEMVCESFGIENFSRLLSNPKQAKKVFDDRGNFALELAKKCIEWGAETIILWDDYAYKSGLFMSPIKFQEYVFPWLNRICSHVHKYGAKVLLHSCGDILPIFEDLINCGIDAFNPIEPTTANPEYNIFKLKEKYGKDVTLIGNVSPQDLADKDPEYIIDYTKKLIRKCGPGGGFIISSGHSINPAVKLENFLAMRETALKYGTYPINFG